MAITDEKYSHLSPVAGATEHQETGTYLDEPPHFDVKDISTSEKKDMLSSASSTFSASTGATATPPSTFTRTKTLVINAKGIPMVRLPLPSSELQIQISTPEGSLEYVSRREKRSSGNATLSDASGKALIASSYLFGPGRDPKLIFLESGERKEEQEVKISGKWTNRSQSFTLPTGEDLRWIYYREIDPSPSNVKNKKRSFLTLEVVGMEKRRLAQLVRNEESRTPGSRNCSAGNGGELVVDGVALDSLGIDESVVVASCLMMLKKEIDRRRLYQIMAISAMASGGGS